MTKPIQYHCGQVMNEKGAVFIEEVPSSNRRRRAKFLCGECKKNTFIASIDCVKRTKNPQFRCKECSKKHGHIRDEQGKPVIDNLLGRRFGYLVVIKYLGSVCHNKHQLWLCQCACGRLRKIRANNLKTGHTKSCGVCHTSLGEVKIEEELQKQGVSYISQYTFPDCKKTRPLRFDFYLPEYNCCIEYDGKQHYGIKGTWYENHEDDYHAQQERDKIKTEYCVKNKIPLYRISYLEYNIIEERIKEILKEVKNDGKKYSV